MLCSAALASVSGCATVYGHLDPLLEQRIDERLRRVTTARMNPGARGKSITVSEAVSAADRTNSATSRPSAAAGGNLALSLSDARRHALQNNLDLSVQILQPEIARTQISEEASRFDATIVVGAAYRKKDLPGGIGDTYEIASKSSRVDDLIKGAETLQGGLIAGIADGFGLKKPEGKKESPDLGGKIITLNDVEQQKREISAEAGVVMATPTGAQLRVSQLLQGLEKLSPTSAEQDTALARFSISQPLLRNSGPAVNLAGIRIARLNTHAETARLRLAAIRLLATAEKAYWQFDTAKRQLAIRRRLFEVAENNLNVARKRAANGLIAAIETIRAEVGVALQREAVIVAETQARIQERELKRILNIEGVDIQSSVALMPVTDPNLIHYELDATVLAREAVSNRIEMLELELALAADDIRIGFARNQILPLITLDFEYGILDRAGSPGSAWRDAWDFDKGEYAIGIKGEIPVTNELRQAQLRRALLSRRQRLATRAARELSIRQEVCDALDVLNQNWQRILAARQSAVAAGLTYEAELKQFDQGLRTMREVYEALAQFGDAQAREANAILLYQIALVDLAYATGTLMGHAQVDFDATRIARPAVTAPETRVSDRNAAVSPLISRLE